MSSAASHHTDRMSQCVRPCDSVRVAAVRQLRRREERSASAGHPPRISAQPAHQNVNRIRLEHTDQRRALLCSAIGLPLTGHSSDMEAERKRAAYAQQQPEHAADAPAVELVPVCQPLRAAPVCRLAVEQQPQQLAQRCIPPRPPSPLALASTRQLMPQQLRRQRRKKLARPPQIARHALAPVCVEQAHQLEWRRLQLQRPQ